MQRLDKPVQIIESNTSFVHVGEITHTFKDENGEEWLWSDFCKRYEKLGWAQRVWCVVVKDYIEDKTV